jgi:cytochrome c2
MAELKGGVPLVVHMAEYTRDRCAIGLKNCARGRSYTGAYYEKMMALILPSSLSPDFRLETCYVDANGNPAPEPPPPKEGDPDPEPVGPFLASASVEAGRDLATRRCLLCHTFEKGGRNRIGPNLYEIVGKPIAHGRNGYPFSPALAEHRDEAWTVENLNIWLAKPSSFAKGSKMLFPGFASAKDRADVIAYLNSLSDKPKRLSARK